jgi:hypothetical protein
MQIDLWRALGVGAGSLIVWSVAGIFAYSLDVSIEVSDYIMLAFSVAILAVFTYVYYQDTRLTPSLQSGLLLAVVMFAFNLLFTILGSLLATVQGVSMPVYPEMSPLVLLLGVIIGLATPVLTAMYLARR